MGLAFSRKGSEVCMTAASEASVMLFTKTAISECNFSFDFPSAVTSHL
jgi:hypothetical protein